MIHFTQKPLLRFETSPLFFTGVSSLYLELALKPHHLTKVKRVAGVRPVLGVVPEMHLSMNEVTTIPGEVIFISILILHWIGESYTCT